MDNETPAARPAVATRVLEEGVEAVLVDLVRLGQRDVGLSRVEVRLGDVLQGGWHLGVIVRTRRDYVALLNLLSHSGCERRLALALATWKSFLP